MHKTGRLCLLGCVLSLITLCACGDDLDDETLIGAACKDETECDVGGVCITTGEDGLCSQKCTAAGAAQQCPLGNYCDEQSVETSKDTLAKMTLCFPACEKDSDCRSGYSCNGVSSGPGKVCHPKPN